MEEKLKKAIRVHTFAILAKYKTMEIQLEQLPTNPDLDSFLAHLNGSVAFYKQHYSLYTKIDLQNCKRSECEKSDAAKPKTASVPSLNIGGSNGHKKISLM